MRERFRSQVTSLLATSSGQKWTEAAILGGILAIAFLLYSYTTLSNGNWVAHPDDHEYLVLGEHLLQTGTLRYREPLNDLSDFPLFTPAGSTQQDGYVVPRRPYYAMYGLVALGLLLGESGPYWLISAFGVLGVLFLYLLARSHFGRGAALLAALLFATSFPTVYFSNMLFPNIPGVSLFLGGLFFLACAASRSGASRYLVYLAAALFAASVWFRFEHAIFIALMAPYALAHRRNIGTGHELASALLAFSMIVPILYVNAATYGSPFTLGTFLPHDSQNVAAALGPGGTQGALSTVERVFFSNFAVGWDDLLAQWPRMLSNITDWVFGLYWPLSLLAILGVGLASWRRPQRSLTISLLVLSLFWIFETCKGELAGQGTRMLGNSYVRGLGFVYAMIFMYAAVYLFELVRMRRSLGLIFVAFVVAYSLISTSDYLYNGYYGLRDVTMKKAGYREFNDSVCQLPEDAVVVGNYLGFFVVGRDTMNTWVIPESDTREAAQIVANAVKNLIRQGRPVYLAESDWVQQYPYLNVQATLEADRSFSVSGPVFRRGAFPPVSVYLVTAGSGGPSGDTGQLK